MSGNRKEAFMLPDPSRDLDARLHQAFRGHVLRLPKGGPIMNGGVPVPAYTRSMDAIVGLVEEQMPGWIWRLCKCSVSDDAWLMPDMNDPEHGARFQRIWPDCRDPLEDGPGLDASFAPSGRPALALCAVFLEVVEGLKGGTPDPEGAAALNAMAAREAAGAPEPRIRISELIAALEAEALDPAPAP
jgi:hypothetical protein